MSRTTASLVCYRSDVAELEPLMRSLMDNPAVSAWVVVDNGATENPELADVLRAQTEAHGGIYVAAAGNIGFGAGHNAALHALRDIPSDFHVMLNPDIEFGNSVLDVLAEVMEAHPGVGLVMPRVLYPDGVSQSHCHLLPAPIDLILRRFAPHLLQRAARDRMNRYEMRSMDRSQPAQVPFFSGCFLFTRRSMLESIGGFDERFFLYMEDLDLCRRLAGVSELLYWPAVCILHAHQRGSYKNRKLMILHARSAVHYFNKWGWIFDSARSQVNARALRQFHSPDGVQATDEPALKNAPQVQRTLRPVAPEQHIHD
jgi:GT2 family glycosyltransferase